MYSMKARKHKFLDTRQPRAVFAARGMVAHSHPNHRHEKAAIQSVEEEPNRELD
jgi:hypothetical protein